MPRKYPDLISLLVIGLFHFISAEATLDETIIVYLTVAIKRKPSSYAVAENVLLGLLIQ